MCHGGASKGNLPSPQKKTVGPEVKATQGGAPKRWRPRRVGAQTQKKSGVVGWGPKGWRAQKFALFPPLWLHFFFSLPSLSWGSSPGILVVFEAPGRSNVHVWVLWLLCEAWAAPKATMLPRQESPRFQAPGFADQSPTIQWNFSSA